MKLNARRVATAGPGKHADGGNLFLVVSEDGRKKWKFIFTFGKRRPELTLGPYPDLSLSDAREAALAARRLVREGINPVDKRRAEKKQESTTFGAVARELHQDKSIRWRNEKYRRQWLTILETHAAPICGTDVAAVDTTAVLSTLKPLWSTKHATATRLRGYIESVLDAAKARGLRTGENPAQWRGHLSSILSKPPATAKKHHAALHYRDLPEFVGKLRQAQRTSLAAFALELTILTCVRTNEALGASWAEIDMNGAVWSIPAGRMKAGKDHRVPLSDRALEILAILRAAYPGEYVFPSRRAGKQMSAVAMWQVLARMGLKGEASVHGMRSAFRDWCGDTTNHPREIAEQALAHAAGDATELSYRRGDALQKRRLLMRDWADYLESGLIGDKTNPN
ncbi:MAG: tyrosine-type recombinase/integrase [Methylocystis sp.]|uniref:tyrosine-type recombinase/integrase n=1 Tax=Methylocystis sp. TaxID=1911079 RepID=UPI003DA2EA93